MDERTVIVRLGALRAPEAGASRERAVEAITARLRESGSARRTRGLRLAGRGADSNGAPPGAVPARTGFPRGRRLLAPALAAACLAAAIVAIASLGGGAAGPTPPAFGAELVRFARATPLLLLEEPGWRVSDVQEEPRGEGQMEFIRGRKLPPERIVERIGPEGTSVLSGERPPAVRQRRAELNWRNGPLGPWLTDRAASADRRTTARVLGAAAHVFRYEGGRPGDYEFTALWTEAGRVLEFRAAARGLSAFEQHLAALRRVGSQRWLEAMPADVIKAADHSHAVAGMLRGVPLPAGFQPSRVPDAGVTTDRYQLGAAVAGSVACLWFRQWGEDLRRGDAGGAAEAEQALAGAKRWPLLKMMEADGAYPEILEELAAAMPSGEWYGRPLLREVGPALGCAEKGVRLPVGRRGDAGPGGK